jgi:hypothetical protein
MVEVQKQQGAVLYTMCIVKRLAEYKLQQGSSDVNWCI